MGWLRDLIGAAKDIATDPEVREAVRLAREAVRLAREAVQLGREVQRRKADGIQDDDVVSLGAKLELDKVKARAEQARARLLAKFGGPLLVLLAVATGCPAPEKDRSPCAADADCSSKLCDISGICSNPCESAYDCVQGEQCRAGVCRLPCDDEPRKCEASLEVYGMPSTCEFHCDEHQDNGACAHGMNLCVMAGDGLGGSE